MTGEVLILRPEPGASRTAAKAEALGLCPVVAPLFTIRRLPWRAPDPADYDAILLTSANAARHAGEPLRYFLHLPCFAVGEATAEAAQEAGFTEITAGPSDGAAAAALMFEAGIARAIHLCGRDHLPPSTVGIRIDSIPIYVAEPQPTLSDAAAQASRAGALVLLHSPRAAARFAELVEDREGVSLAAISAATAAAAGGGWALKAVAERPRDEALLELAARLCNYGAPTPGGTDGGDGL